MSILEVRFSGSILEDRFSIVDFQKSIFECRFSRADFRASIFEGRFSRIDVRVPIFECRFLEGRFSREELFWVGFSGVDFCFSRFACFFVGLIFVVEVGGSSVDTGGKRMFRSGCAEGRAGGGRRVE